MSRDRRLVTDGRAAVERRTSGRNSRLNCGAFHFSDTTTLPLRVLLRHRPWPPTDSPVSRPRIDFVAGVESTHASSDPDHDSGHVMAQNERQPIRQNEFELAVSDFGIQKVDAGGVNLDQNIILPQLRIRHFASPHTVGASVTIEDECLHRRSVRGFRQRPGPRRPAARVPSDPRRRPAPCPGSSCRERSPRCLR
jgi:hypothetical protein